MKVGLRHSGIVPRYGREWEITGSKPWNLNSEYFVPDIGRSNYVTVTLICRTYEPPASITRTETDGSSVNRLAITLPAVPATTDDQAFPRLPRGCGTYLQPQQSRTQIGVAEKHP